MPYPPARQPPLCVLGFDTSTERLAVALHAPGGPWHRIAEGGAAASSSLLPMVAAVLKEANQVYADLDCIAFGRGPGAFTGLRTACAVAQGLGLGLCKPLLPIDSLMIVAEDARAHEAPGLGPWDIGVAMDARMGEVYAGTYRWRSGAWQVLQAPALHSLDTLAAEWQGVGLHAVAGSALAVFGIRLPAPAGATRHAGEHDRAAALLRLAEHAADAGQSIDAAEALPLYLRDKVALTTREREAARAAALPR